MAKEYIEREKIFPNGVFLVNKNDPLTSFGELINRINNIPAADVVEVKHGRWVNRCRNDDDYEGFYHHVCSHCKTEAPFHYIYIDDYDEGIDGEWYLLGKREDGIEEVLSDYCPNCGAKMDLEVTP